MLLTDDFEPSACPVEPADELTAGGWGVARDAQDPPNHVLHGSTQVGPIRPAIDRALWRDYEVRMRLRLDGSASQTAGLGFRIDPSGSKCVVKLEFNLLRLYRCAASGCLQVAEVNPPGGVAAGPGTRWTRPSPAERSRWAWTGPSCSAIERPGAYRAGGVDLEASGRSASADFDDVRITTC